MSERPPRSPVADPVAPLCVDFEPVPGRRELARTWVTPKGAAVVSDFGGRDGRTIVTDESGSLYVHNHDDGTTRAYDQYDPSPSFPRVVGHRDAGATSRVVPRRRMRGRRMDRLGWFRLSRLTGDLGRQLVGQRRDG